MHLTYIKYIKSIHVLLLEWNPLNFIAVPFGGTRGHVTEIFIMRDCQVVNYHLECGSSTYFKGIASILFLDMVLVTCI